MKAKTFLLALALLLAAFGLEAKNQKMAKVPESYDPKAQTSSIKVRHLSPKHAMLRPGSVQKIIKDDKVLSIEYVELHKKGKFPVVKIQGLPFKLNLRKDKIEFTWQGAGYELMWLETGIEVSLKSSEPFGARSLTPKSKQVQHKRIYKGLKIQAKRNNGMLSSLEVMDVQKNAKGRMNRFSVRTMANQKNPADYQQENNIGAPGFREQYEKGINGEILYIFTTDSKGRIFVYYR